MKYPETMQPSYTLQDCSFSADEVQMLMELAFREGFEMNSRWWNYTSADFNNSRAKADFRKMLEKKY